MSVVSNFLFNLSQCFQCLVLSVGSQISKTCFLKSPGVIVECSFIHVDWLPQAHWLPLKFITPVRFATENGVDVHNARCRL